MRTKHATAPTILPLPRTQVSQHTLLPVLRAIHITSALLLHLAAHECRSDICGHRRFEESVLVPSVCGFRPSALLKRSQFLFFSHFDQTQSHSKPNSIYQECSSSARACPAARPLPLPLAVPWWCATASAARMSQPLAHLSQRHARPVSRRFRESSNLHLRTKASYTATSGRECISEQCSHSKAEQRGDALHELNGRCSCFADLKSLPGVSDPFPEVFDPLNLSATVSSRSSGQGKRAAKSSGLSSRTFHQSALISSTAGITSLH